MAVFYRLLITIRLPPLSQNSAILRPGCRRGCLRLGDDRNAFQVKSRNGRFHLVGYQNENRFQRRNLILRGRKCKIVSASANFNPIQRHPLRPMGTAAATWQPTCPM